MCVSNLTRGTVCKSTVHVSILPYTAEFTYRHAVLKEDHVPPFLGKVFSMLYWGYGKSFTIVSRVDYLLLYLGVWPPRPRRRQRRRRWRAMHPFYPPYGRRQVLCTSAAIDMVKGIRSLSSKAKFVIFKIFLNILNHPPPSWWRISNTTTSTNGDDSDRKGTAELTSSQILELWRTQTSQMKTRWP